MYFILLPLFDSYDDSDLNYTERLDLIKNSLCFKSCSRNTKFSYALLLLEVVASSAYFYLKYIASVTVLTQLNTNMYFFLPPFGFIFFYCPLSICCYKLFDRDDYRNRRRRDAENLSGESVERPENNGTNE